MSSKLRKIKGYEFYFECPYCGYTSKIMGTGEMIPIEVMEKIGIKHSCYNCGNLIPWSKETINLHNQ